jgi:hypothetical protein
LHVCALRLQTPTVRRSAVEAATRAPLAPLLRVENPRAGRQEIAQGDHADEGAVASHDDGQARDTCFCHPEHEHAKRLITVRDNRLSEPRTRGSRHKERASTQHLPKRLGSDPVLTPF